MVKYNNYSSRKKVFKIFGIPIFETNKITNGIREGVYGGLKFKRREMHFMPEDKIKKIRLEYKDKPKELLIVFSDSIGDYILFRNFLKILKNSQKYKSYRLVLLCSKSYYNFARYLDCDIIDEFIQLPSRMENMSRKKYKKVRQDLHQLYGLKNFYDTIISPSINSVWKLDYHRYLLSEVLYNENIIYRFSPNDDISCSEFLDYTHVFVNYDDKELFIFDAYKAFFEDLLEEKITLKYPFIEENKINSNSDISMQDKGDYIIINPCAFNDYRMWHRYNYIKLIEYIKNELGLNVVIVCGGNSEKKYCEDLVKELGFDIRVFSGLCVQDLLRTIKYAKLYIGQDSGVFHIAAALDVKALCLSAGNAYFQFMNYPSYRKNIKILRPTGVEDWIIKNKTNDFYMINSVNSFYINQIRVSDVIKWVNFLLLQSENSYVGVKNKC